MYVTPEMVRAAVDPAALSTLCDAGGGEVADANPVLQLAMARAHSEVTSTVATEFPTMPKEIPDGPVSTFLQIA
jgi:hypothetical protein